MIYRHVKELTWRLLLAVNRPDFGTLNAKGKDFLVF